MGATWILLTCAGVAAVGALAVHTRILGARAAVEQDWQDIVKWQRRKNKNLPKLDELAKIVGEFEDPLQARVGELRAALARLTNTVDAQTLADVERQTASLLRCVQLAAEASAYVRQSALLGSVIREFNELQQNIAAAMTIFNRDVADFNALIETPLGRLVNRTISRQDRVEPFTGREAEGAAEPPAGR